MVAISLSAIAFLRPTFRFSPYIIRQSVGSFVYGQNRTIATSHQSGPTTTAVKGEVPSVAESMATNPMPILAKADPEGKVLEDLPKLSMADFQTYNRLAVMMDYYVRINIPQRTLDGLPKDNTNIFP